MHDRFFHRGAWRQAGMMAAAGRFAIDNHWERMHEDHRRAKRLAEGMQALGFELICEPQTNIVIVNSSSRAVDGEAIPSSGGCSSDVSGGDGVCLTRLASLLEADGILIKAKPAGTRLYTHLQIDDDGVHYLLARIEFHMRSILSKKYE